MIAPLAPFVGRRFSSVLVAVLLMTLVGGSATARTVSAQTPTSNLEVVLAIDVSASMRPAIDAAKAAAEQFIDSMPEAVSIGLLTFGDEVNVLSPPTTDRELLRNSIDGIRLEEDTALYDAVVAAASQFSPTVPEKVIVLLSDGKDEGSQAPLEYAVASLQGIRVEAISLSTQQTDLSSLAALGSVTSADDAAAMAAAFERVAGLLAAVVVPQEPTTTATTAAPTTTVVPSTTAPTVPATEPATGPHLAAEVAVTDPPDRSSIPLAAGAVAVFVALFLLVATMWPEPRVSKARLGIERETQSVSELGRRTAAYVESALERRGKRTEFATTLAVANVAMRPGEYFGLVGAAMVVVGLLGLVGAGVPGALVGAAAVYLATQTYVRYRTAKRRAAFAEQLPDVLQLVTRALRSGFGLAQALDAVVDEAEEPAKGEFATALTEARLGRDLPAALQSVAQRMKSEDLAWAVAAIDINRDVGGNLSDVLSAVDETIRERQRMARQVNTYTAEGRFSARILTVLPIAMALWQWRVNPENFERMFDGGGLVALIVAGVLLALGSLWIRRIVNSISV